MVIHQFTNLDNVPLKFDKHTERIFFTKFLPVKEDKCSVCNSRDIVHYEDLFQCFNCKKRSLSKYWDIMLKNGYLMVQNKEKIIFFHRYVMENEIKKIKPMERINFHIHHKDKNKLNNSKDNLELIDAKKHFRMHASMRHYDAFRTYCSKKYGDVDEFYMEEFNDWIEEKGGEKWNPN